MVLTETFYKKISAFVLPRERQTLEETLARAQDVLKQAHKKGVELQCISEVTTFLKYGDCKIFKRRKKRE